MLSIYLSVSVLADVKATLVSPFVGRITDWFKKAKGVAEYAPRDDPGVQSVTEIFKYYKAHGRVSLILDLTTRRYAIIEA